MNNDDPIHVVQHNHESARIHLIVIDLIVYTARRK